MQRPHLHNRCVTLSTVNGSKPRKGPSALAGLTSRLGKTTTGRWTARGGHRALTGGNTGGGVLVRGDLLAVGTRRRISELLSRTEGSGIHIRVAVAVRDCEIVGG